MSEAFEGFPSPEEVLNMNWQDGHTVTESHNYSNYWPGDAAIAVRGLALIDPERAAEEVTQGLFSGQWENGFIPHMVYARQPWKHPKELLNDRYLWGLRLPMTPKGVRTSGVSAQPVFAEAVWGVAKQLPSDRRAELLRDVTPKLVAFHR